MIPMNSAGDITAPTFPSVNAWIVNEYYGFIRGPVEYN